MQYSTLRKWLKNLTRTIVVITTLIIALTFYSSLHKIIGLTGVILGSIVVLITPALINNKLYAESTLNKNKNVFTIIYGIIMMIVLTFFIILTWNKKH
jgi:hypothetical protein